MVPIAAHVPSRAAALALAEWLGPDYAFTGPEALFESPVRPWVLVISTPTATAFGGDVPKPVMATVRRAVLHENGEVDDARMDDDAAVFHRLAEPLPERVIEQFYRDNAHLRPRDEQGPAGACSQAALIPHGDHPRAHDKAIP